MHVTAPVLAELLAILKAASEEQDPYAVSQATSRKGTTKQFADVTPTASSRVYR